MKKMILTGGLVALFALPFFDLSLNAQQRGSHNEGGSMERGSHMGQERGSGRGSGMGRGMMRGRGQGRGQGRGMGNRIRHQYVMRGPGIPAAFRGVINPLHSTRQSVEAGRKVYVEHCQSCHGAKGIGDGAAGKELSPPPANIAHIMRMPMMATDSFLLWTIVEGGVPLKTAMPAYGEVLSQQEHWQLIHFLRSGLGQ